MLLPQGVYHCPHQATREDPIRDRRGTYSKLKLWKANPSIRAFRRPSRANRHRLDLHYLRYGLDVEMCEIPSLRIQEDVPHSHARSVLYRGCLQASRLKMRVRILIFLPDSTAKL